MWMRRLTFVFALALGLSLAGGAAASVMREASVDEMTREADVVARGRVLSTESKVSADGGRISTVVTLEVVEPWKGTPGSTVRIVVPGGVADGIGQTVHGAPTFATGEDVVVFLRNASRVPAKTPVQVPMRVVAMAQGKLDVRRNDAGIEVAVPDLSEVELLRPGAREPVKAPEALPVPVADLKARVKAATP